MATGIRQRHGNRCKRPASGCKCPWQAEVYSKRDAKKVRELFPTRAAAKGWRDDKLSAANRRELRAPTAMTVRQAAMRSWRAPATARFHGLWEAATSPPPCVATRSRSTNASCPTLGGQRLSDVHRRDVQELADRLTGGGAEREHGAEHASIRCA